jgi:DNA-3-methyladenine glycosylase I
MGDENQGRCWWCGDDPLYVRYHDGEWGVPVYDNVRLFEKISLEGFQAGLSWITILRKRENFRAGFDGFDYYKIAKYSQLNIDKLMIYAGIVRHRGKIEAVINNAQRAIEMEAEFGSLANYFWQFKPDTTGWVFDEAGLRQRSLCPEAVALSKDLKKRGWKFVGPTTMYAFMQAMGLVNDHVEGCFRRNVLSDVNKS